MTDQYISWDAITPAHLQSWSAVELLYTLGHDLVFAGAGLYIPFFLKGPFAFTLPEQQRFIEELAAAHQTFHAAALALRAWRVQQQQLRRAEAGDHPTDPELSTTALSELRALILEYYREAQRMRDIFQIFTSLLTHWNDNQDFLLQRASMMTAKQWQIANYLQDWLLFHTKQ